MTEETLQPEKPPTSEVLVIAGMSGAGRTTAAHALEDHGWDVVENMPPALFGTLAELIARSPEAFPRLAIVVDVRSRSYFEELYAALQHLAHDHVLDLLGLDAGALERAADRDPAEFGGGNGGDRAAELADRGAGGSEDDGLGHGAVPLWGGSGRGRGAL